MPNPTDFISQSQYSQYTSDWLELLNSGSADALRLAFQAPDVARINFLTFSIDQLLALVTAADVALIKTRFLLMPDGAGQPRVSTALFAVDASGHLLTEYYIPTPDAATSSQTVGPSTAPSTQIPYATALQWLTDWVDAGALTMAMFSTSHGPMHGYNFEVSTFQDPLADAPPYDDKTLFFNYGLSAETGTMLVAPAVYIGQLGSRTQGSLAGIPTNSAFYDKAETCPPSP